MIDRIETMAMAQVQPINKRWNELDNKVEANLKAIEEIKAATDMALRNTEMVDSAKVEVEGELRLIEEQHQWSMCRDYYLGRA
ncbi:hypothetical protein JHK86_040270 [Glycine max]|nr:hypothetical protein JHK86_040270 [Glycine max]